MGNILRLIIFFMGSIYSILFIVFSLVFLLIWMMNCRNKEYELDYKSRLKQKNKRSNVGRKELYGSSMNSMDFIVFVVAVVFILFVVICVVYEIFNNYVNGVLDNIDKYNDYVLALTSIVITAVVFLVAFDKKYYLVFSIKDVLQKYNAGEFLVLICASSVISTLLTMSLLDKKVDTLFDEVRFIILMESVIINIYCVIHYFFILYKILFSQRKNELALLNKLYQIFWHRKIGLNGAKKRKHWNDEAIEINIDYLVERYVKTLKKIKYAEVKSVKYDSFYDNHGEKVYKKSVYRHYMTSIVWFVFPIIINILKDGIFTIWLFLFYIIWLGFDFLLLKKPKSLVFSISDFYVNTWGYVIRYKDNRIKNREKTKKVKEIYVSEFQIFSRRRNSDYIKVMNSMIAFMYLLLDYVEGEKKYLEHVEEIVNQISDFDEENMIANLPMFIIGYFAFRRDYEIDLIREKYELLGLQKEDTELFLQMMESHILFLTGKMHKELYWYRESFQDYTNWLLKK